LFTVPGHHGATDRAKGKSSVTRKYPAAAIVGCLIGLVVLSGCVSGPVLPPAPPATTGNAAVPAGEYVIGGNDVLVVNFQYNPDFNQTLTVQPDGRIKLPMIGSVMAGGQTPTGLAAQLARDYNPYLQRPDISVIVQTTGSQQAFIGGEVVKAGMVALQPGMTISSALIAAGGLKDSAEATRVVLLRRNQNGAEQAYNVNVASAMNGSDLAQDIVLQTQDIVVAPKSGIANVNLFVLQYVRNNLPIGLGTGFSL
jgi:protein involved in polysaccharide export with SLBB domain